MRKDVELRICAVFCRIYLCDRSIHRSIYFGGRGKNGCKRGFWRENQEKYCISLFCIKMIYKNWYKCTMPLALVL